jgi:hypothetical protein
MTFLPFTVTVINQYKTHKTRYTRYPTNIALFADSTGAIILGLALRSGAWLPLRGLGSVRDGIGVIGA